MTTTKLSGDRDDDRAGRRGWRRRDPGRRRWADGADQLDGAWTAASAPTWPTARRSPVIDVIPGGGDIDPAAPATPTAMRVVPARRSHRPGHGPARREPRAIAGGRIAVPDSMSSLDGIVTVSGIAVVGGTGRAPTTTVAPCR